MADGEKSTAIEARWSWEILAVVSGLAVTASVGAYIVHKRRRPVTLGIDHTGVYQRVDCAKSYFEASIL